MHKTTKPVRKCHGCKLNIGGRCAIFPDPRKQWRSGRCKGYQDEQLYRQYLDGQAKHPPDKARERRRTEAEFERTNHPPSFMPGFRVRKR